ncbi:hypothetical protein TNIN_250251 [Trichonephila inaurata madagascariensis]|uniref:Uncharacterized protein n=1 Tax=Trichonephila inaurata madagascariensis TaxID=2747483 RepID=A0A8X6Y0R1_9ARAC|nr:hypothetical protein TNIN_250251 [Trichonephila inaurata madagascariensis]
MFRLEVNESFASGRLPVDYAVNPKRGIEEDEKFSPLALDVRRPTRSIKLDTYPQDGSEFIHLSSLSELYTLQPIFLTARQRKMYRYRVVAQLFEKRVIHFKQNRATLIKKFPLQFDVPGEKDEKEWCKRMVKSLLKYLHHWFLAINMHDSIARWIFSFFMCLEDPVEKKCQNLIGVFKHAMRKRLRTCGKREGRQLSTIMAILDLNFRD